MHWAAELIGMPYRKGGGAPLTQTEACGNLPATYRQVAGRPESFDCWSLVRHVFVTRYGITMPVVAVADGSADNVAAIKRAAMVSGWRPAAEPAQDGDIVLMVNLLGERHVGVMVEADGRLGLLHAVEGSGVCWQELRDVVAQGFRGLEFWRLTATPKASAVLR